MHSYTVPATKIVLREGISHIFQSGNMLYIIDLLIVSSHVRTTDTAIWIDILVNFRGHGNGHQIGCFLTSCLDFLNQVHEHFHVSSL
jgi:hypothetical protein